MLGFFQVYFVQVRSLTEANLKSRYRNTVSGFIWVVLNPIVMYGIQCFAFSQILQFKVNNYMLYLLSGLLPWIFIVQALEMSTSTIVGAGPVLKSFSVHPLVFVLAQILDNFVNFMAAFVLVFIPVLLFSDFQLWRLVLLPIPVLILGAGVFALAWFLATLQVFFRDTKFVLSFVLNGLFFLTPIFYPPEFVPDRFRWIIEVNIIYMLIRPFSAVLYDPKIGAIPTALGEAILVLMILFSASYFFWQRKKDALYVLV